MDEEALKVCLVTQERERGFTLGAAGDPECNVPPFDATRIRVRLWAWPWNEWPIYDEAVFDRDLSRILRWYRARGFYQSAITSVSRKRDDQEHKVDLAVAVHEGDPVLVERIDLHGIDALERRVRRRVERAIRLDEGDRFDEVFYDDSKRAIEEVLRDSAYAKASVAGRVSINTDQRRAQVTFDVTPGRRYRFGKVTIEGQGNLPARPIWGAAAIEEGSAFSVSQLNDAKRAIYELGPFASVDIDEKPNDREGVVDVHIKVVAGRSFRTALGLGMQVGVDPTLVPVDLIADSLSQWDVHLLGKVEHRNFLGGMRRISLEDRPRLIFNDRFPGVSKPEPGNLLILEFRQPALFEARTSLVVTGRWDRGPDPYGGGFSRSDLLAGAGPERTFFDGKLRVSATVNTNVFVPDKVQEKANMAIAPGRLPLPSYYATYLQYSAVLDLRDDPREPRRGTYFGLAVQQAGYFLPSEWDYVRITPDVRGYLPLPFGAVLAGRARIGIMEITDSTIEPRDNDLGFAQRLRDLGPLRQRLRGGGNNSVRGYEPNTLGDVVQVEGQNRLDSGGTRQWEASLELRVPITSSFGAVLFTDIGDVSREKRFRFNLPQTTFGFGFRYKTLIGPIRLDFGIAPPGLQAIGKDERSRCSYDVDAMAPLTCGRFPEAHLFGTHGTFHFTIGEAY